MSAQRILRNPVLLTLFVALLWQLTLFVVGWAFAPHQGPLGHINHWDAGWYLHIIEHGYSQNGSPAAPAFYPLFPFLVKLVEVLSFGIIPPLLAALIINTAALWAALYALLGILRHFKLSRTAKAISLAAFIAFPSAFFMHVFYSEAVFIAVAFWSYLFALQKRWYLVGISLAVLTAARLPSLLFVALCGLEYLRAYNWNVKKALNKNILWFLLAPLGFILYGIYLSVIRGDFLAMFHAYKATDDWVYQVFNPNIFATLYDSLHKVTVAVLNQSLTYELFVNTLLPLVALAAILTASIYVLIKLKKNGIPLFVFGVLSILLFTLNSNVVSVHRYTLACIVIYIALGLFMKNANRIKTGLVLLAVVASLMVQLFLYIKFMANVFAG